VSAKRAPGLSPGLTLVEILVAMSVFALTGVIVYGALAGSVKAQEIVEAAQARTHAVRLGMLRMNRELQGAFLVKNAAQFTTTGLKGETLFVGRKDGGFFRLDFTSFSHERTQADINESDQCELSYFVRRAEGGEGYDLMRRESKRLDSDATKGGVIAPLIRDVTTFELSFYDPEKQEWGDEWDTKNAVGQPDRVPSFVKITIGIREADGEEKRFSTIVKPALVAPVMEVR
jgi:type II secretion system protein J